MIDRPLPENGVKVNNIFSLYSIRINTVYYLYSPDDLYPFGINFDL